MVNEFEEDVTELDDTNPTNAANIDQMDNMGGSSQVECHLSQHREDNDNNMDSVVSNRNTYYKEALPLFEEKVNSFPNKHLFDEMSQLLRKRHIVHISSRGINNRVCNPKATIFFVKMTLTKEK